VTNEALQALGFTQVNHHWQKSVNGYDIQVWNRTGKMLIERDDVGIMMFTDITPKFVIRICETIAVPPCVIFKAEGEHLDVHDSKENLCKA